MDTEVRRLVRPFVRGGAFGVVLAVAFVTWRDRGPVEAGQAVAVVACVLGAVFSWQDRYRPSSVLPVDPPPPPVFDPAPPGLSWGPASLDAYDQPAAASVAWAMWDEEDEPTDTDITDPLAMVPSLSDPDVRVPRYGANPYRP